MYGTLNSIEEICVWLQHLRGSRDIFIVYIYTFIISGYQQAVTFIIIISTIHGC